MGRRPTRLKAERDADQKSARGCIIMALIPLLLLGGIIGLGLILDRDEDKERRRNEIAAKLRARENNQEAVTKIMEAAGAGIDSSSNATVITLPASQINITSREAMEIAMSAHQRLGKRVRVQTPAGQVLAEAP